MHFDNISWTDNRSWRLTDEILSYSLSGPYCILEGMNVNNLPFFKFSLKLFFLFSVGGMNRSHRLSQGAKKVTPPSVPGFNPRASGSSFGSDCSNEREDAISRLPQGYQANIGGKSLNFPWRFQSVKMESISIVLYI